MIAGPSTSIHIASMDVEPGSMHTSSQTQVWSCCMHYVCTHMCAACMSMKLCSLHNNNIIIIIVLDYCNIFYIHYNRSYPHQLQPPRWLQLLGLHHRILCQLQGPHPLRWLQLLDPHLRILCQPQPHDWLWLLVNRFGNLQ